MQVYDLAVVWLDIILLQHFKINYHGSEHHQQKHISLAGNGADLLGSANHTKSCYDRSCLLRRIWLGLSRPATEPSYDDDTFVH